ncbi:hypothetical protein FNAPI_6330 [Fusarium napiforme]|uniref:Uncharacterized protein n=1 Tax=Fusarium napiforme TaxID=42672 RepID=A0A8H5JG37_9HYPO|nr:hypothetical protein FNAPI_6330 [Fusarium napiforme]
MSYPRPTLEADNSPGNGEQSSGDASSDWNDSEEEEDDEQSNGSSYSDTSDYDASSPRGPVSHNPGDNGSGAYYGRGVNYGPPRGNGLYGNPLVPYGHGYPYPQAGQPPDHYSAGGFGANQSSIPTAYPSGHVHYPRIPNMPPNPFSYQAADMMSYHHHQAPVRPGSDNPRPAADTSLLRVESPSPARVDPEKIRLEAEIAAFKAMEEKIKTAEMQKEAESQIRREAEQALQRRLQDMQEAQEEAKKEIERARSEAEKAACERLQAELKAEEDRSRRFKDFATNLEKKVRLKVEMEKIAQSAEREARAKQNEDRERLAKLKMMQSMDKIINLTKKEVLHDFITDGESIGSEERQGWLMETQNEVDAKGSVWRAEAGQLSARRLRNASMQPGYANASSVRSSLCNPLQQAGTPRDWKDSRPHASNLPGSELFGGAKKTTAGGGLNITDLSQDPGEDTSGSQRQLNTYDKIDGTTLEDVVDRIADAVVERLVHSPYHSMLMHKPSHIGQHHGRDSQPIAEPYTGSQNSFLKTGKYGNEENSGGALRPLPGRPPRQFYKPFKPAYLRGRSLRGPTGSTSSEPPLNGPVCSQGKSFSEKLKTSLIPQPPPEVAVIGKRGSENRCPEVEDTRQKAPTVHGSDLELPKGGGQKWRYPHMRIEEVDPSLDDISSVGKRSDRNYTNAFADDQNGGDDLQRAYQHIFHGTEVPLP